MFFAFFCCAIWAFLQRYRCFEAFTSALQLCSSWLIRPSFVPHSSLVPCEEPVHWMAWLGLCFARPRTWDVSVASAAFRNIRSTDFSGLDGKNEEYSGQLTQLTSDDIDIVKFQLWIDWIWSKIWDQLFPVVSGDDWLFGMREALGGKEKCSPQRYPEISRGDIDFDDFESINRDISPDIWTIFDEFDWIRHDQTWSDSKALDLVGTTKSSCYRCFFLDGFHDRQLQVEAQTLAQKALAMPWFSLTIHWGVVAHCGAHCEWFGYGSIPIDTFLVGWTSIYQLFWGSL